MKDQLLPFFQPLTPAKRNGAAIVSMLREQRDVPPVDPHVEERDVERLSRQNRLVLSLLREGPLTQIDADKWNVRRLAARVLDLREAGYAINSVREGVIAKYTLVQP